MKQELNYLACFYQEEDGSYTVMFPDLPTGLSEGKDKEDALNVAKDLLCETLDWLEEEKEPLPKPSLDVKDAFERFAKEHHGGVKEGDFVEKISAIEE